MASVLLHFLPPFMAAGFAVFSCSPLWELSYSAAFCIPGRLCVCVCVEVALAQLSAAAHASPYTIKSSRFSSVNILALSEGNSFQPLPRQTQF